MGRKRLGMRLVMKDGENLLEFSLDGRPVDIPSVKEIRFRVDAERMTPELTLVIQSGDLDIDVGTCVVVRRKG